MCRTNLVEWVKVPNPTEDEPLFTRDAFQIALSNKNINPTEMPKPCPAIIYYDGECGFCNRAILFLISIDKSRSFTFARLQGKSGQSLIANYPELRGIDSAVLIEPTATGNEHVAIKFELVRGVARHLSGRWGLLFGVIGRLPRRMGDWVYDFIAKYRKRIYGGSESCPIPSEYVRSRFLD
jgi:predicted DCC family thiol-disulfide oxidoreductase YuxK